MLKGGKLGLSLGALSMCPLAVLAQSVVQDDFAGTFEAQAVVIPVFQNDSGNWVSWELTQPSNGTSAKDNNDARYTPAAGFTGVDVFTYSATDDTGATLTATVSVKVNPPLVAGDDFANTTPNTDVLIPVLANDSGDIVSGAIGTSANATVAPLNGGIGFSPNQDFQGVDSFTYTLTDSIGETAIAQVTVSVNSTDPKDATLPIFVCSEQDAFCNVTQSTGLDVHFGYGRGAALVDVDGDGWDDIFLSDCNNRDPSWGTSKFYLSKGNGTRFEFADLGLNTGDIFANWTASFADYDNDGDQDVIFVNGGYSAISELAFYENKIDEVGVFVPVTDSSGIGVVNVPTMPSNWWGGSWSDVNGDGWLDVVVTRTMGSPVLFLNNGDKTFTDVTSQYGINIQFGNEEDGKNPVWLDYDDDGDDDLYIAGYRKHALYKNEGGTGFVDVTAEVFNQSFPTVILPAGTPAVFAAGAADFNQDGVDDLYLGRWNEQDLLMLGDGTGGFSQHGENIGLDALHTVRTDHSQPYENTMGLGIGDLFNDGFPDVYIGSGDPERADKDILYCNDGTSGFYRCTERINGNALSAYRTRGHAPVFGDVNQDGKMDLLVNLGGHPEWDTENMEDTREHVALYVNQSSDASTSATVTLEGTASNRDATGSRVKVTLNNGKVFYYALRSTQAFQAQNSRAVLLNLDGESSGDVEIAWPSGKKSQLTVAAGDRTHVVEPQE